MHLIKTNYQESSRQNLLLIKSSVRIEYMNSFHTWENLATIFCSNASSTCHSKVYNIAKDNEDERHQVKYVKIDQTPA